MVCSIDTENPDTLDRCFIISIPRKYVLLVDTPGDLENGLFCRNYRCAPNYIWLEDTTIGCSTVVEV